MTSKKNSGSSSGTIANYVKAARSFFSYLLGKHYYALDTSHIKLPKIQHRERRVPTDADIAKLIAHLEDAEDTVSFYLLVDCGIRVHELATIQIEKVNFDDSSIEILGKGGKMRTVYFSETTGKHLRAFVNERKSGYLFQPKRSDGSKNFAVTATSRIDLRKYAREPEYKE